MKRIVFMEKLNFEKFLIYLRQIQNKIQKDFNEDVKALGISSTHMGIIMILKNCSNGCSMSELSRLNKVDNALMTRNIKELEKINYVYRNREKESQRKYHICLTEDGKQMALKLEKIIEQKQQNFLNNFTEEEKKIIDEAVSIVIQKFMKTIEKEEKEC